MIPRERRWPEPPYFSMMVTVFLLLQLSAVSIIVLENNASVLTKYKIIDAIIIPVYYNSFIQSGGSVEDAVEVNICVNLSLFLCAFYIFVRIIWEIRSGSTQVRKKHYSAKVAVIFILSVSIFATMRFGKSMGLFDLSVSKHLLFNVAEIALYFGGLTIMLCELMCQQIASVRSR